jgi:transcriptional regulator
MTGLYIPAHFHLDDEAALHDFIRAYPLATLVTGGDINISHLPMLIERDNDGFVLRGHVARANPHWKIVADGMPALAMFHGPQAYITPQWYPSKLKDGRVVPTWNYAVVHVRGMVRAIQDADWLLRLVNALTEAHEKQFAHQWAVSDAPDDYIQKMLKAIVGLELRITGMEGKWKLSQNRDDADYAGTKAGLTAQNTPDSLAVNALMKRR